MSIRFLHLADIHLGFRQYNSAVRERDFFLSFASAIERFALPPEEGGRPQVDFVLIVGDLFESRTIQPITLSRATVVFSKLKEAGIPVFAIEGNHDSTRWHRPNEPNWYNYLASEGLIYYLRDFNHEGKIDLIPWSEDSRSGSYFDFNEEIRIIGSHWYGAAAHSMIELLDEAIAQLPPKAFNILMFHGGLTGYINEMHAGISVEKFSLLKERIQYLALGHIHQRYEEQGWIFNPGSLEASKVQEALDPHGAFIVEVEDGQIKRYEHRMDYFHRPFVALKFKVDGLKNEEELIESLKEFIEDKGRRELRKIRAQLTQEVVRFRTLNYEEYPVKPVVSIQFFGVLQFPFSTLDFKDVEEQIKKSLDAEIVRFANMTHPKEFVSEDFEDEINVMNNRDLLEKKIFQALFANDSRYERKALLLADYTSNLKKRLLEGELLDEEAEILLEQLDEILFGEEEELFDSDR